MCEGSSEVKSFHVSFLRFPSRSVETTWQQIGSLLDAFPPHECANYLRNSGYAST
ncbi:hypothetical protein SPHINGO8AM_20010 [Sphingomonas sp. 8AM]|nr:hypothetical protein SPHINGO8AM_20010 [Sphingomonas sp. 8AM]